MAGIQVELWRNTIVEGLYADNAFLGKATDRDEYVLNGAIVHIPQSGGSTTIDKNRTVFPIPVVERADTDILYALDTYNTAPIRNARINQYERSYDTLMSYIREEQANLLQYVGSDTLISWFKNLSTGALANIAATGTAAPATGAGMTGNRKTLTAADVRKAQRILDEQNVPMDGRVLLIDPSMRESLLADSDIKNTFYNNADYQAGKMFPYAGFEIMVRTRTVRLNNAAGVKAIDAVNATSDNISALFWQKTMVERALGAVEPFQDYNRPEYLGDLINFLVRFGGRAVREDQKGIGQIIMAP
jgi:Phage capsid protein